MCHPVCRAHRPWSAVARQRVSSCVSCSQTMECCCTATSVILCVVLTDHGVLLHGNECHPVCRAHRPWSAVARQRVSSCVSCSQTMECCCTATSVAGTKLAACQKKKWTCLKNGIDSFGYSCSADKDSFCVCVCVLFSPHPIPF